MKNLNIYYSRLTGTDFKTFSFGSSFKLTVRLSQLIERRILIYYSHLTGTNFRTSSFCSSLTALN
jgi:hypothetical protein